MKVTRRDFVTEGLADLRDAERHAHAAGIQHVFKFRKMPCAVSGRRYALFSSPAVAPTKVWNIRLNCFGSVSVPGVFASGTEDIRIIAADRSERFFLVLVSG
jgi:hypothetical protein